MAHTLSKKSCFKHREFIFCKQKICLNLLLSILLLLFISKHFQKCLSNHYFYWVVCHVYLTTIVISLFYLCIYLFFLYFMCVLLFHVCMCVINQKHKTQTKNMQFKTNKTHKPQTVDKASGSNDCGND